VINPFGAEHVMKSVVLKTLSDIYLPLWRGHLNSGIFLWTVAPKG